jgi:hypothetical protein
VRFVIPFPPKLSASEREELEEEDKAALRHIADMRGFSSAEIGRYLEAAQKIAEYEEKRKAGAETRATAYLAAIAALIPLMTWALGNTTPLCSSTLGCHAWSMIFDIAVGYFLFAAWWCLRTLSVANYHAFGVEDLVEIKGAGRPLERALLVQTLQQARANRNTINAKLDYLKTAQRCFFLGLLLIGALLAIDPWFRFTPGSTSAQPIDSQQGAKQPPTPASAASAPASAAQPAALKNSKPPSSPGSAPK